MSLCTQYCVGEPDARTPWIAHDFYVENIEQEEYPSPYPESVQSTILTGVEHNIQNNQSLFDWKKTLVHSIETTSIVATNVLKIHMGSILVGEEIRIKAPIVRIYDNVDFPIRTTLVPKWKLSIRAERLFIDGADIVESYKLDIKVKYLTLKNVTPTTQWLENLQMRLLPQR